MSELYIPQGAVSLADDKSIPQIRLGIQGDPGYGKTWSSLTFPNPVVLNFDRGLGSHIGRKDVIEVPFYLGEFCDKWCKRNGILTPPNRRDALLAWLGQEGIKLTPQQTLIFDSGTQIEVGYHIQYKLAPKITKSGDVDDFAEWRQKVEYYGLLMDIIKQLKCHVVYLSHETDDRDKKGELNGKIRPLLTGQFADQLASHFTDYFRAWAISKDYSNKPENKENFKKNFGLKSDAEMKEILSSTDDKIPVIYAWETYPSELVPNIKTSTLIGQPRFVLANYSSFTKYGRKQTVTLQ